MAGTERESPIRVLLVDDHAVVRAGLRLFLADLWCGRDLHSLDARYQALVPLSQGPSLSALPGRPRGPLRAAPGIGDRLRFAQPQPLTTLATPFVTMPCICAPKRPVRTTRPA